MPLEVQAVAVFDENQKVFAVNSAPEANGSLRHGKTDFFRKKGSVLDGVVAKKMGKP